MANLDISFTPVDNLKLSHLCGAMDENLRQMENGIGVQINRRNERFNVEGAPDKAAQAIDLLKVLYSRAARPIEVEEVQLGIIETLRPDLSGQDASSPVLLTRRPDLRGRTARQVEYLRAIQQNDITFGIGPAGTGKTYLAVASAVDALERDQVKRLVLVRPAVEAGEKLGFLPGDMAQKVDPYLRPLYDALYDLMGYDKVQKCFERQQIEIAPLAFMRGRTLNHSFIILDEAQNTTPEQMKMFLTRIGFGSKAVVTGDVTQIDLDRRQKSGLIEVKYILNDIKGLSFHQFMADDVVRHPLVQRIVQAYDAHKQMMGR